MATLYKSPVLTVRIHAGFNADAFLAGLLALSPNRLMTPQDLLLARFPDCNSTLTLEKVQVNHIAGASAKFVTPHEHVHRTPADIAAIYDASNLSDGAREIADSIWGHISGAEAAVHGTTVENVHFHEVGRLSNILAVGLIGELLCAMNPRKIVSGPIPVGDGVIRCAHGIVPNPAPAMLAMLDGVAVKPFAAAGEPVSPTGLAVLKGIGAEFGPWPEMTVAKHVTVFANGKYFEGAPNGTIFALGE